MDEEQFEHKTILLLLRNLKSTRAKKVIELAGQAYLIKKLIYYYYHHHYYY